MSESHQGHCRTSIDQQQQYQQSRMKIRLTVHSAKNLLKKELFKLPDPFAKVIVEDTGQCHCTGALKATLDPKWNQHYDLFLSRSDSIIISVWNSRKVHKRQGAGFLGCVRLNPASISRLKDTGYQRLNLSKNLPNEDESIRGQLIVSLTSREPSSQVITAPPSISTSTDGLPEGWEKRRTPQGREYFINHYTHTTQWNKPLRPGYESVSSSHQTPNLPNTILPHLLNQTDTQLSTLSSSRPSSLYLESSSPDQNNGERPASTHGIPTHSEFTALPSSNSTVARTTSTITTTNDIPPTPNLSLIHISEPTRPY